MDDPVLRVGASMWLALPGEAASRVRAFATMPGTARVRDDGGRERTVTPLRMRAGVLVATEGGR